MRLEAESSARVKEAEAERSASEFRAKQLIIEADASKEAASREAESRKIIAEAKAREEATIGLSEAQVIEAKASATAGTRQRRKSGMEVSCMVCGLSRLPAANPEKAPR